MISNLNRFHGYGAIKAVYRGGQTFRGSTLSIKIAPRTTGKHYRAAVVVSKKVHKSAVFRNRIRRRIYEIIRTAPPELVDGKDIVVTVFGESTATMPAAKLEALVTGLLKKAH